MMTLANLEAAYHLLAKEVALQEGTIERLCIQAVTWDGYDDQVKRVDQLDDAIHKLAEASGVQL